MPKTSHTLEMWGVLSTPKHAPRFPIPRTRKERDDDHRLKIRVARTAG